MILDEYLKVLRENEIVINANIREEDARLDVRKVSYNSANVIDKTLFICKGSAFKEEYLESAIEKGSICYVYDANMEFNKKYDCSSIMVSDIRKAMGIIGNLYYEKPWESFYNIGITGTKGKTTVTYFVRNILEEYLRNESGKYNKKVGFLSSIITFDGDVKSDAVLTTPEIFELQEYFRRMKDNNIKYELMEVSSQALKFDRTFGVEYDIACFTNISNDHIGTIEHPDFEDYFSSKLKILHQCSTAVINNDMEKENLDRIFKEAGDCKKVVTYGLKENSDVTAKELNLTMDGVEFTVITKDETARISIPMIGRFNVSNALAAIAITSELNVPVKYAVKALRKSLVPGRMTVFKNEHRDIIAVVDFAHNKLSYIAMFESLRDLLPDAKYSIVFGCPGSKGLNRRKDLGEVVNDYVTKAILTEEDCGIEDPVDICHDINKYIDNDKVEVEIIPDREEAIQYALENAAPGEVVIIAGKSADTTIKRGKEYVPIDSDLVLCGKYIQ